MRTWYDESKFTNEKTAIKRKPVASNENVKGQTNSKQRKSRLLIRNWRELCKTWSESLVSSPRLSTLQKALTLLEIASRMLTSQKNIDEEKLASLDPGSFSFSLDAWISPDKATKAHNGHYFTFHCNKQIKHAEIIGRQCRSAVYVTPKLSSPFFLNFFDKFIFF